MDASDPRLSPLHTWGVTFGRTLVFLLTQLPIHEKGPHPIMQGLFHDKTRQLIYDEPMKRTEYFSFLHCRE